jgi:hypothetical protein
MDSVDIKTMADNVQLLRKTLFLKLNMMNSRAKIMPY